MFFGDAIRYYHARNSLVCLDGFVKDLLMRDLPMKVVNSVPFFVSLERSHEARGRSHEGMADDEITLLFLVKPGYQWL